MPCGSEHLHIAVVRAGGFIPSRINQTAFPVSFGRCFSCIRVARSLSFALPLLFDLGSGDVLGHGVFLRALRFCLLELVLGAINIPS